MLDFFGNRITAVWIDLDDTIIDFKANSRNALARIYLDEKLDDFFESDNDWICLYERHNYELWRLYAEGEIDQPMLRMERFRRPLCECGMSDATARQLSSHLDTVYLDRLAEGTILIDGALELLDYLRMTEVKTGILSNGFKDVQHRKIRSSGLERYFDYVVLSDDAGFTKPDPKIFEYAMFIAGETDPRSQLMIGDNRQTDICGAVGAGWNAIMFDSSLPLMSTSGRGHHIVSSLSYIPRILTHHSDAL